LEFDIEVKLCREGYESTNVYPLILVISDARPLIRLIHSCQSSPKQDPDLEDSNPVHESISSVLSGRHTTTVLNPIMKVWIRIRYPLRPITYDLGLLGNFSIVVLEDEQWPPCLMLHHSLLLTPRLPRERLTNPKLARAARVLLRDDVNPEEEERACKSRAAARAVMDRRFVMM